MDELYARTVFFVRDGQRALDHYTQKLGFTSDWVHEESGRPFVVQVSLLGFQLILNQIEPWTESRAGHGRVFIGLEDDQLEAFQQHLEQWGIEAQSFHWGAPTVVIRDMDDNEIFVWLPPTT